jgi:hypothetical protein
MAMSSFATMPSNECFIQDQTSSVLSNSHQAVLSAPQGFESELSDVSLHKIITTQWLTQTQLLENWTDFRGLDGSSSGFIPVSDRDTVADTGICSTQLMEIPLPHTVPGSLISSGDKSSRTLSTKLTRRLTRSSKKHLGQILGKNPCSTVGRRHGPLSPQKRMIKVGEIRERGACERCRLDKAEVPWISVFQKF